MAGPANTNLFALYRDKPTQERQVLCGSCVYHEKLGGGYVDACSLTKEYRTDCVTGKVSLRSYTTCQDRNFKLDCKDYVEAEPNRPWWRRWLGM